MRAKTYPHTCHHPKKDIREKKRICNLRAVPCWLVRRERGVFPRPLSGINTLHGMCVNPWVTRVAYKCFFSYCTSLSSSICLSVYSLIYLGKCDKVTVIEVDESV